MKFDVIIGNPPYLKNIHLRFLRMAYKYAERYVIFVEPASWLITVKETFKGIKNLIQKNTVSIDIHNPYELFNSIYMHTPAGIIFIDKLKNNSKININDAMINKKYVVNSIQEINKWGNAKEYISIKNILETHVKKYGSLTSHRNNTGNFYVNFANVRGHVSPKGNMFSNPDFYTFIPNDLEVSTAPAKKFHVAFDTKKEAENFIYFLKTKFARFSLAIHKIHINLHYDLVLVPWMNFTERWTDEKLNKYFNLSSDEIKFINENIADY